MDGRPAGVAELVTAPIGVITGVVDAQTRDEVETLGVVYYRCKPLLADEIASMLRLMIEPRPTDATIQASPLSRHRAIGDRVTVSDVLTALNAMAHDAAPSTVTDAEPAVATADDEDALGGLLATALVASVGDTAMFLACAEALRAQQRAIGSQSAAHGARARPLP